MTIRFHRTELISELSKHVLQWTSEFKKNGCEEERDHKDRSLQGTTEGKSIGAELNV